MHCFLWIIHDNTTIWQYLTIVDLGGSTYSFFLAWPCVDGSGLLRMPPPSHAFLALLYPFCIAHPLCSAEKCAKEPLSAATKGQRHENNSLDKRPVTSLHWNFADLYAVELAHGAWHHHESLPRVNAELYHLLLVGTWCACTLLLSVRSQS